MGTGAAFSGQHDISATHSSTQRSAFAARAAPPGNPVIRPFTVLSVLVGFLVVITLINRVFPQIFVFLLGTAGWSGPGFRGLEHLTWWVIALAVAWLIYGFTRLPAHRAAVEHWRKTWVCLACGGTFVPDA